MTYRQLFDRKLRYDGAVTPRLFSSVVFIDTFDTKLMDMYDGLMIKALMHTPCVTRSAPGN